MDSQWIMKYSTIKNKNNNYEYNYNYNIILAHEYLKIKIYFTITPQYLKKIQKTGIVKIGDLIIDKNKDSLQLKSKHSNFILTTKGSDIVECLLWLLYDPVVEENTYYTVCEVDSDSSDES
jgi:hypothetical protein